MADDYREYLQDKMNEGSINTLFKDELKPFDNKESYYPGDNQVPQQNRVIKIYH